MSRIKLTDAAKYYKALPHQTKAFEYLESAIDSAVLSKFEHYYRTEIINAPEENTPQEKGDRLFIAKILQRISQLGLSLDKPPSDAPSDAYAINIIGIEGLNPDFTLNNDVPNHWNDLFLILGVDKDLNFRYFQKSVGTTEPGSHYTYNPMNPQGAARITIDTKHEKIWKVGCHGSGSNSHLALVQTGNQVCVTRDANKDFQRTNDKITCGYYGINFHWGYDMPINNIGRASAGCQVIRSRKEQQNAMKIIKTDYYYVRNNQHRFSYFCLDGSKIFSDGIHTGKTIYKKENDTTESLALELIIKWECGGDVTRFLDAYADPAHGWNVPTIGIGTIKYPDGRSVKRGDRITEEDARRFCLDFIRRIILPHLRSVPGWKNMAPKMQAALISFAYNLGNFYGANGFNTISTRLKSLEWSKVPEALRLYVKAGGRTMQGLVNRRNDEGRYWQEGLNSLK